VTRRGKANTKSGRKTGGGSDFSQLPYQQPRNPYQPFNIISDDQVDSLHQTSLNVLSEIGINFLCEESREILKNAGADVKPGDPRVRFDPGLIEESIKTVPAQFSGHARNPAHNLEYGGNYTAFCMVASPPNATDLDNGRRQGNFEDYCNFIRLGQTLNIVHQIAGYPVEPTDIAPPIRHLVAEQAAIKLYAYDNDALPGSLGQLRRRDLRRAYALVTEDARPYTMLAHLEEEWNRAWGRSSVYAHTGTGNHLHTLPARYVDRDLALMSCKIDATRPTQWIVDPNHANENIVDSSGPISYEIHQNCLDLNGNGRPLSWMLNPNNANLIMIWEVDDTGAFEQRHQGSSVSVVIGVSGDPVQSTAPHSSAPGSTVY